MTSGERTIVDTWIETDTFGSIKVPELVEKSLNAGDGACPQGQV
jgi:hypothetical protein